MFFQKEGHILRAVINGNNVTVEIDNSKKYETIESKLFWKLIDAENWVTKK